MNLRLKLPKYLMDSLRLNSNTSQRMDHKSTPKENVGIYVNYFGE